MAPGISSGLMLFPFAYYKSINALYAFCKSIASEFRNEIEPNWRVNPHPPKLRSSRRLFGRQYFENPGFV